MKKFIQGLLLLLAFLIVILLFNTFQFKSRQLQVEKVSPPELSPESLHRFQQAIQFQTVSNADSAKFDSTQFNAFHRFLKASYPLVHSKLSYEWVRDYSLLYKWEGKSPEKKPIVLMAHQDVVPVEPGTESLWSVNPFEGVVKNDTIWGRGTTDDKMNLIAIYEAAERLLAENFQPERTIYLSFGHDEEVGGKGAQAAAELLKSRNIEADLVLDEGGIITQDKVPGLSTPVALIGTSEKGYLSLKLSVEESGGHSSMPAPETSIDILTKAIVKLRQNPFDAGFSKSTQDFMTYIGPEMAFAQKIVFANQWLFKDMIVSIYEKSPGGNAMVRTTTAPTIIEAGVKDNVIPTLATATINFRILPGDTKETVMAHVQEVINDPRVHMEPFGIATDPTSVTSIDSFGFRLVEKTIRQTFDKALVAPFLMIGATDSRHFGNVSTGIIKFSPMNDPIGFHGINERISIESYREGIGFFEQLIRNID